MDEGTFCGSSMEQLWKTGVVTHIHTRAHTHTHIHTHTTLTVKPLSCPGMSGTTYAVTRCHVLEEFTPQEFSAAVFDLNAVFRQNVLNPTLDRSYERNILLIIYFGVWCWAVFVFRIFTGTVRFLSRQWRIRCPRHFLLHMTAILIQ
jgi:hypothetical protein